MPSKSDYKAIKRASIEAQKIESTITNLRKCCQPEGVPEVYFLNVLTKLVGF